MRWISSAGGPLVLLPLDSLADWQGNANGDGAPSDYDIACAAEGYTNALIVRNMSVLVLNDEPLQTAFLRDATGAFFVRWMYAPGQPEVDTALAVMRGQLGPAVEAVDFQADTPNLVLMDAAEQGAGPSLGDRLSLHLEAASYKVSTHIYKPSSEVALLIHAFSQRPSP
jgi:immunity protein 21 of polymorphic toxin system